MSMLLSAVKSKGITHLYAPTDPRLKAQIDIQSRALLSLLRSPECTPVNANPVVADLTLAKGTVKDAWSELLQKPLRLTPGRANYWFDFELGVRTGVLCQRKQTSDGWELDLSIAIAPQSQALDRFGAVICALSTVKLNDKGELREMPNLGIPGESNPDFKRGLEGVVLAVCHTLARLNCKNVRIVPVCSLKGGCSSPPPTVPVRMSSFNEIVIDPTEKVLSVGKSIFLPDDVDTEVRFHVVRGHYRRIPKSEDMIWVAEYSRGNKERGQIAPTYIVH